MTALLPGCLLLAFTLYHNRKRTIVINIRHAAKFAAKKRNSNCIVTALSNHNNNSKP